MVIDNPSMQVGRSGVDNAAVRIGRHRGMPASQFDQARVRELGVNHEQCGTVDLREGIGAVRYETASGRTLTPSTTQGADSYDGGVPISLKGLLADKRTGASLLITDRMVDGLANAVVRGAQRNTAARDIVADTLGMSGAQRDRLLDKITEDLAGFDDMSTNIIVIEQTDGS